MKIHLGYVSLSKALDNITTSRTITFTEYQKLDEEEKNRKINDIILSNLESLKKILTYNYKNNIHFYRLTSKLIPLSTHEQVNYEYLNKYNIIFKELGNLIKDYNIRVDTHPDQYCVLNSVNPKVVKSSISILEYHKNMLLALNIKEPKIILHVGSNNFGKQKSITRFINNFNLLNANIKKMLIIENDDKIFNVCDVLELCNKLKIPMVLDYHHFMCNNNGEKISSYIEQIFDTWNNSKLVPKIHFSSPKNKTKKDFRSHNDYIDSNEFIKFVEEIKFVNRDFDIMIEAKMKDEALFRLVRELKYKTNYRFIDSTTFIV